MNIICILKFDLFQKWGFFEPTLFLYIYDNLFVGMALCGLRIYLKEQKKIDDHSFPDFFTTYRRWANKNSKLSSLRRLSALIWTDLFLRFLERLTVLQKTLIVNINFLTSKSKISSLIRLLTYQCTFWFSSSAILSP